MNIKFLIGEFPNDAWTIHLKRISDYLAEDEGVWWMLVGNQIIFKDGDTEDEFGNGMPMMMNFTENHFYQVNQKKRSFCIFVSFWKTLTLSL